MAKQTATQTNVEPKVERITRQQAANRVITEIKGKTTLGELAKQADDLFISGGGKTRIRAAMHTVRAALETCESLGVVKLTRPTDILVDRVR